MKPHEALRQCVEAMKLVDFKDCAESDELWHKLNAAQQVAEEVLKRPEQEPVAWITYGKKDGTQKLPLGSIASNPEYCKVHKEWLWEPLYAAPVASPQPPAAPSGDVEPDMLWDASDPEQFANEAEEFARDHAYGSMTPGDVSEVKLQCAKRLPNRTIRIEFIRDESGTVKWGWVESATKE